MGSLKYLKFKTVINTLSTVIRKGSLQDSFHMPVKKDFLKKFL